MDTNKSSNIIGKTFFISDLHLSKHHPETLQLFHQFLDYCISQSIDNLYILGDFFNYWIDNQEQHLEPWHQELIKKFEQLSKICPIYFMHGNRDFLINKKMAARFYFKLLPEDINIINLYHTKITLLHGDTLCTNDKAYQKYRKLCRNYFIKKLFLSLPYKLKNKIAGDIKKQSTKNNQYHNNNPEIFDVTKPATLNLFETTDTNIIIHGHTHKPKVHQYDSNNNKLKTRYVLGDWHADGAYYLEVIKQQEHINFDLKLFETIQN